MTQEENRNLLSYAEWLLDLAFLTDETEELNNPEGEDSQRQSWACDATSGDMQGPPDKVGSGIWGQIHWPCEPGVLCHFHECECPRAFWTDGRTVPSVIQKCQDFQKQIDAKKLPSIFSGALKRATIYRRVRVNNPSLTSQGNKLYLRTSIRYYWPEICIFMLC